MWATIIIILTVSLMLGPIMLMRPSASQSRIASLRAAAQKKGLRVRMEMDPRERARTSVAVYSLAWADIFSRDLSCSESEKAFSPALWMLVRQDFSHGVHFCAEWDWREPPPTKVLEQASHLKSILGNLDESFVALESTRLGVSLYWYERKVEEQTEQAIEKVLGILEQLATLFCQR